MDASATTNAAAQAAAASVDCAWHPRWAAARANLAGGRGGACAGVRAAPHLGARHGARRALAGPAVSPGSRGRRGRGGGGVRATRRGARAGRSRCLRPPLARISLPRRRRPQLPIPHLAYDVAPPNKLPPRVQLGKGGPV